jgi:hypothetical protein
MLSTHPTSSQSSNPQRVLACVLCQRRKVKCDRKSPCANCIKTQAQCTPAILAARRRRRRFPERELLERLRKYEDLLGQNKIQFEPLPTDSSGEKDLPRAWTSDGEQPEAVGARNIDPENVYEAKYVLSTTLCCND